MKKMRNAMMLAMALSLSATVGYAAGGEGGGSEIGLAVETVNFADGGHIAVGQPLELLANKNVCNLDVKDNNYTCFAVLDANGNPLDIEIILYDDQLENDRKGDITIHLNNAIENETYQLNISENLMAKNGTSMGYDQVFTFTVGDEQASSTNALLYGAIAVVVIGGILVFLKSKKKA